jgi:hypothetical protein
VLSGDDGVSMIDASITKLKESDDDDAEGEGTSSAEPIAPNPISPNVPVQIEPSIANRVATGAPSAGRNKWKHPPTIPKRKPPKTSTD